ncbi:hypothetical protein GCM10027046_08960 [Uliginosibacterium flavum]|uniref:Pectate lyase n=1 Tax=Uliginosibacterium flavum TaxID=1396831 RepID=A0ABV2TKS9_9RHOO
MQRIVFNSLALLGAALVCAACAGPQTMAPSSASSAAMVRPANTTLLTIALIMGEPNFSMDSGYQELEEGLYTMPELKPGKRMFAPIQDIVTLLGGEYQFDPATSSAHYRLNGQQLALTAGSVSAQLNNSISTLDLAPERRGGSLWVPVASVFDLLGAYTKWDEARQRLSATFIMPVSKKTEDLAKGGPVTESTMTTQAVAFYASADGRKLADVVLGYQNKDGGWPKLDRNVNMLLPINTAHLSGVKGKSTIDNDSTLKQVRVLARAYTAFGEDKYRAAFNRGLDYLLAAQLQNGGWQQFWPDPIGYKKRITFNDDAIANALEVMRDISAQTEEFRFVDKARLARAKDSFQRGLDLIIKTQLLVGGKKTGWCAQYDEASLAPVTGRSYELPSISGHESVNVIRFLMSLDKPSPAVVQTIQDAVAWLDSAKLLGQKRVKKEDRTLEWGADYVIVKDPKAPPIWARFYDLDKGQPLFTSRDGIKRTDFSEVAYERRVKYNWFSEAPRELLGQDYPQWQQRWAPGHSVLK